ncbi:Glomulin, partial [Stegodyphus mimosarum]
MGVPFEADITNLLKEKKFEKVLELLKNPENDNEVTNNVWNLVSNICSTLKTNGLVQEESDVILCKKLLLHLVDRGNPKEIIIALMEEADSFKDHSYFCLLLDPLQRVLKKVPGKRGKSLEWVLSTLNAHIQTLPLPEDLDLQGDEKLLLDADSSVIDTNYVLENYYLFLEPFVDEVSHETLSKKEHYFIDRVAHQQEILQKHILKLFYHPFLFHDLYVESEFRPKSTIRILCEKYVKCSLKITRNVIKLFSYDRISTKTHDSTQDEQDVDQIPKLAFANLAYLLFVENFALDFQPFVYSHQYEFIKHMEYVIILLSRKENLVLFKGLKLAQSFIDKLMEFELSYDYTELEISTRFPIALLNVAIYCQIETHRKTSVNLFLSYISKCDWKSRYHLIMQVITTINHSGVQGLVINLCKNYVHETLTGNVDGDYFVGRNLNLIMRNVFTLSNGVETDILENCDKIVTALNFLRYLLLKDQKNLCQTGVWDMIDLIKENFIHPLGTGLDLSRAHYKQVAKDADEAKKQKSVNTTVSVNSEVLPNIPLNFQKEVFEKALVTFDMIESILSRVKELISY